MAGGYLSEYLLKTDIPGVSGGSDFEGEVYNWAPPQVVTRYRDVPANGLFMGKRTRLGMQLEPGRMSKFVTQGRFMELDASQYEDHTFEFFGLLVNADDPNGDTVHSEYHNVYGHIADVVVQDAPAEGGQEYTYMLYVRRWYLNDAPIGVRPQQGWRVKHFDYDRKIFAERKLVAGNNTFRGYAGDIGDTPLNAPANFRELRKGHELALGREPIVV